MMTSHIIENTNDFIEPALEVKESNNLGKLYEALAKAQGEMEVAEKDSKNPYFKSTYASLDSIIKASRPALSKYGLAVLHKTYRENGVWFLAARLGHSSGQWIEACLELNPPKPDIQSRGSYITYLKRYTYCNITGVVTGEGDDDGEAAMDRNLTKEQLKALSNKINGDVSLASKILKAYGVKKLSEISSEKYEECMKRIAEFCEKKEKKEVNNENS